MFCALKSKGYSLCDNFKCIDFFRIIFFESWRVAVQMPRLSECRIFMPEDNRVSVLNVSLHNQISTLAEAR